MAAKAISIEEVIWIRSFMAERVALLLGALLISLSGCTSSNNGGLSSQDCYEKDDREAEFLAKEVNPYLATDVRSTFAKGSACDSNPDGGAWISYDLESKASMENVLDGLHEAGWKDLPKNVPPCLPDSCVAGVTKVINGRAIEATMQESGNGGYILEATLRG